MSHHRALKQKGLAVAVLALLLTSSESLSYGMGGLPPLPCPCDAEGVCRPNRLTWGYSQTRWRSWPGEQPALAEQDATGESVPLALPPYETPRPDQEDLRGPVKGKAAKADEEAASQFPADEEPAPLLPGLEAPAFDPQGNHLELPGMLELPGGDDAPPVLPTSLRQVAQSLNMPQPNRVYPKTLLEASSGQASSQNQKVLGHAVSQQQPPTARPIALQPIRQARWQQPSSIQLVNPASAIVLKHEADALQQAIYYEASDQGKASDQGNDMVE